jgi:hypothetical protein
MHPISFFFLSHLIFSKDIRLDKGLNWADPSPRVYNIYILPRVYNIYILKRHQNKVILTKK